MTMVDVRQAFQDCEFPYYKNIEINGDQATCTLYSIRAPYNEVISLPTMNYDKLLHTLSLAIIKFRSYEMIH